MPIEVESTETLDEFLIKVEAGLSSILDARLKTLEARVEACHTILLGWDKELAEGKVALGGLLESLESNPVLKSLMASGGGFGF